MAFCFSVTFGFIEKVNPFFVALPPAQLPMRLFCGQLRKMHKIFEKLSNLSHLNKKIIGRLYAKKREICIFNAETNLLCSPYEEGSKTPFFLLQQSS
jgi:hypothetical protein